jgi:hypothetical protein
MIVVRVQLTFAAGFTPPGFAPIRAWPRRYNARPFPIIPPRAVPGLLQVCVVSLLLRAALDLPESFRFSFLCIPPVRAMADNTGARSGQPFRDMTVPARIAIKISGKALGLCFSP